MKPSEFVEKYKHTHNGLGMCNVCNDFAAQRVEAVVAWLDEEYEKNQPCKHEEWQEFRGMKECFRCKVVFV